VDFADRAPDLLEPASERRVLRHFSHPIMQKKIILLGSLPPPYGGVAIFCQTLFASLRNYGAELWSYSGNAADEPGVTHINHRRLGLIPMLIRKGSRAKFIDSSHFLVEYPNPLLLPAWLLLKPVLRFEWIKVIHDGSLPSRYADFGAVRRVLCRLAVRSVSHFVVVNDDLNVWLRKVMGVRQPVSIVNALLPIPPEAFNAELPAELTEQLSRHRRRMCSTGNFAPFYGFDQIADAVERLRHETGDDIGLVLIDGTLVPDKEYRERILQRRDWITVLENVPHREVLKIFMKSDAFVRGTQHEGYSLSRIEAVWCGIPVLIAGGEESRGMLHYDFGDEGTLVRQMRKALYDPPREEMRKWSEQFRREAEENLLRWQRLAGVNRD
jgi:glycosyltransferase involved in cell wall biosynthesis